jgi:hypothetical protein
MATSSSPLSITATRTLQVVKAAGGGGGGNLSSIPNLYRQTFENIDPTISEINNFNLVYPSLFNNICVDLDGGTTAGVVYRNASEGILDPPNPVPNTDWRALEGNYSMRVRIDDGNSQTVGQVTNHNPVTGDYWVRYWMRVPKNFTPSNHLVSQHKIFECYQDGRSQAGEGSTVWLNIYGNGTPNVVMQSGLIISAGGFVASSGVLTKVPFFDSITDRGRWMQLVILMRYETSLGADDGLLRVWKRWQNETTLTLHHDEPGLSLQRSTVAGADGWKTTKFLSAREGSNGISEDWLFDAIEMSTDSLL